MKNDILEKELSVEDVQCFNSSLKRLHLVLTQNYENYQTLIEEYLKIGSEIFNLETGIVSKIVDKEYIFMDLQMPVMDGFTATQRILASSPETKTKIMAMTANAFETDKQMCLDVGMVDFISKPVRKEVLYTTILSNI